ncbi:MAG: sulfite exporter TauE/SafE family protein [Bacteroidota bacterium]
MLLSAIALGFLGSLHCLGMCGPIAFMLPLDRTNTVRKRAQLFLYHLGRLLSYAIKGLVFGFVGKGLYLFGMQQKLSIIIGALMIFLVLVPNNYFKKYGIARPMYQLLSKVKSKLGTELKKKTPDTFLTIGFLNGFLPCGLVYMALFGSIALASPLEGSLYMALFGLGTVPLMTSVLYFKKIFKSPLKQSIRKAIPAFVVLVGLLFIVRGMGLGIPYISPKLAQSPMVSADIECHQQP